MTDAPTEPRAAASAEPLGRLHHMSTTAGITSQEYVAINIPAVVSTLLGLASLTVLVFHQIILLVIPLAAIVFGVVALVQIKNSNGTQSGRAFAWVGIVLAVLLGGGEVATRVVQTRSQQSNQDQVAQLLSTLGQHVAKGDDVAAYALFSEPFRQRVPRERFDAQWGLARQGTTPLSSIEWNGVPMLFQRNGAGNLAAMVMAVFKFRGINDTARQALIVRQGPKGWEIDDIPSLFPDERKRGSP